jgi:hypothetical protein
MKRSSQVALLLMGTVAVGGGAYAMMPSERDCRPGVVQPDGQVSQNSQHCNRSWHSSSSGGGGSSGWRSSSSSSSSSNSSQYFSSDGRTNLGSSSSGDHSSSSVSRGGFGSFASHFSGGG